MESLNIGGHNFPIQGYVKTKEFGTIPLLSILLDSPTKADPESEVEA